VCESNFAKVDRFRQYHRDLIAHALSKGNHRFTAIHSNVLLCCILDRIAKAGAPHLDRIGDRFKAVVEQYADWADANRVSILHLARVLMSPNLPDAFNDVKRRVDHDLGRKLPEHQNQIFLTNDPLLHEVENYWPTNNNGNFIQIDGFVPELLTHSNMLWLYRNSMVHEYSKPGRGSESPFRREHNPYYQKLQTFIGITPQDTAIWHENWEMVYPTAFITDIVRKVLEGVCDDFRSQNTSPFSFYSEGTYWNPKLNLKNDS